MNIATLSTRDFREQGRKTYVASYRAKEELVIHECFLVHYVNEGDSQRFSFVDDSQYSFGICDWILENRLNCHIRPIPFYWHS